MLLYCHSKYSLTIHVLLYGIFYRTYNLLDYLFSYKFRLMLRKKQSIVDFCCYYYCIIFHLASVTLIRKLFRIFCVYYLQVEIVFLFVSCRRHSTRFSVMYVHLVKLWRWIEKTWKFKFLLTFPFKKHEPTSFLVSN